MHTMKSKAASVSSFTCTIHTAGSIEPKSYPQVNPSRSDPGQRENKFKLNFLFSHFFVVPQKVL